MRLTRCFVDAPLKPGSDLALPPDVANHLVRVLRLEAGDEAVLFNGDGNDYAARIAETSKREVRVDVLAAREVRNESPLRITLLQGIARGEKMDLILQKATELGVHAIVPVNSQRSEVKLDAQRAAKRLEHWRSVIVSACEQSGRTLVPGISAPANLAQAAQAIDCALKLTLDPEGGCKLVSLRAPEKLSVCIAIGPEGGWSPHDRDALQNAGFSGLQLGPRILRTETAGLAAIAALQAKLGDL